MPQLLELFDEKNFMENIHVSFAKGYEKDFPILPPFRSDHFSFFIVLEGTISYKINLLEYTSRKNSILALSPNDVRQITGISTDCECATIAFTTDYLNILVSM